MKVLILGAGGFIGSSLKVKLAKIVTDSVIAFQRKAPDLNVDQKNVKYIIDDFVNIQNHYDAISEADIIIHAISALLPVSESFNGEIVNVISPTVTLLSHFKNSNKHFIFISSGGAVYELNDKETISEEMPLKAYNFYGFSKRQLEDIFLFYSSNFNISVTIIRPSNVFGYRKGNIGVNGIISTLISNAVAKKTTQIWGTGKAVRDYIHVDDFCDIIWKISNLKTEGIFNISSGNAKSVNDIIEIVNKYLPYKCIVEFKKNDYHLPEYIVLNNNKINSALPAIIPSVFEQKIKEMIFQYQLD